MSQTPRKSPRHAHPPSPTDLSPLPPGPEFARLSVAPRRPLTPEDAALIADVERIQAGQAELNELSRDELLELMSATTRVISRVEAIKQEHLALLRGRRSVGARDSPSGVRAGG
jgi:hypothetical protein